MQNYVKVVELARGGNVINRATPSNLKISLVHIDSKCGEVVSLGTLLFCLYLRINVISILVFLASVYFDSEIFRI